MLIIIVDMIVFALYITCNLITRNRSILLEGGGGEGRGKRVELNFFWQNLISSQKLLVISHMF